MIRFQRAPRCPKCGCETILQIGRADYSAYLQQVAVVESLKGYAVLDTTTTHLSYGLHELTSYQCAECDFHTTDLVALVTASDLEREVFLRTFNLEG